MKVQGVVTLLEYCFLGLRDWKPGRWMTWGNVVTNTTIRRDKNTKILWEWQIQNYERDKYNILRDKYNIMREINTIILERQILYHDGDKYNIMTQTNTLNPVNKYWCGPKPSSPPATLTDRESHTAAISPSAGRTPRWPRNGRGVQILSFIVH